MSCMEERKIGEQIRALRQQLGMQSKELAEKVNLDPSAISLIESGKREVKIVELVKIANIFGKSPLAILEPDSLVARLPVAARSEDDSPSADMRSRLTALAELHDLLTSEGIPVSAASSQPPDIAELDWLKASRHLAVWARSRLELPDNGEKFDALVNAIEDCLGIDVLVEPYDAGTLGTAITDAEFPFILINSEQPRNRALFTLAHELGHVISRDGQTMTVHQSLTGVNSDERRANAFAAEFLMPQDEIKLMVEASDSSPQSFGEMMRHFFVSWESLVYRMHNLGFINSGGRDLLRGISFAGLLQDIGDQELVRQLLHQRMFLEVRAPKLLTARLLSGYRRGVVSVRPLAGLLHCDPDELLEQLTSENVQKDITAALTLLPRFSDSSEVAYAGEAI